MKRKEFIKTTAAFTAGSLVLPIGCKEATKAKAAESRRTNWAGNYEYKAKQLHRPESTEEVRKLIRELEKQKALGSRHCFNDIADSPLNQISTENLIQPMEIDPAAMTVTVGAGIRYGDIAPGLHRQGYALHNLASLPHISIAGACATATHGSGWELGNLATAIAGLEMVTGSGEILHLNRKDDPEMLDALVVNLGALGIVTRVTLDIQETYEMRQDVFQDLPWEVLKQNFEAIMGAGYSVSLFTDWQGDHISQVWVKRRTDREIADLGPSFYEAKAATRNLHPITRLSAENCTAQLGVPGPWYERLPHFKMGFTPSSGEELQSEFFVPRDQAVQAILAVRELARAIGPELQITEIRSVAADNLWMSPCYKQDSVAIHFTWKQRPEAVDKLIGDIESVLEPFGFRPHWGKLFHSGAFALRSRYPQFQAFLDMVQTHDPHGKFKNDYLERTIYRT